MQEKTLHKVDRPNKYTHFAEMLHTRCVDKMVYLVMKDNGIYNALFAKTNQFSKRSCQVVRHKQPIKKLKTSNGIHLDKFD